MLLLGDVANSSFVLRSAENTLSLDELQSRRSLMQASHQKLQGKTVAIHGSADHFVKSILYLDGFADCLVLVPKESCSQFVSSTLNGIKIDAVVVDDSVDQTMWPLALIFVPSISHNSKCLLPEDTDRETQWMLPTSGTTGLSKYVKHTLTSLLRTVARSRKCMSYRWGLLYDPARFAGLQVVLQALASGASLVILDEDTKLIEKVSLLIEQRVTALSGTPTYWKQLLMIDQFASLNLQQITLGGEIVDERLINSLKTMFSGAHITHIYASTEAGVGFAVHDGKEGFPLDWIGKSVDGLVLGVSSANTLMIQSQESAQSYAKDEVGIFDSQGWYDTEDLVEVINERVVFRGRLNGSINVGGNKVMPEEVERHIEKLSFVHKAIVSSRKNSIVGNLLEATVVLTAYDYSDEFAIESICDHCRKSLAVYKVPAFVKVAECIPISASGKIKRG